MADRKLSKADKDVIADEEEAERVYQEEQKEIPPVEEPLARVSEPVKDITAAEIGGLTMAICAKCGKEIGLLDSFEVLPGDNVRVHRPACKV